MKSLVSLVLTLSAFLASSALACDMTGVWKIHSTVDHGDLDLRSINASNFRGSVSFPRTGQFDRVVGTCDGDTVRFTRTMAGVGAQSYYGTFANEDTIVGQWSGAGGNNISWYAERM